MRLVLINVGGGIPGHGDQATHGSPAKFSYCAAHPKLTALHAAKGVVFRATEPEHFHDWHNAPRRQYVITLEGEVEIGLGDLTGQGHTTRVVGNTRRLTATIHLAD